MAPDRRFPGLILQPESRPITKEQLEAEVKSIYAGLSMVEVKTIDVNGAQSETIRNSEQQSASPLLRGPFLPEPVSVEQPSLLSSIHSVLFPRSAVSSSNERRGLGKPKARFEIPQERNLQNIDALIANSQDEAELKELKRQKRLLRNRQAALDSRQRKKKHIEELEESLERSKNILEWSKNILEARKKLEELKSSQRLMKGRFEQFENLIKELEERGEAAEPYRKEVVALFLEQSYNESLNPQPVVTSVEKETGNTRIFEIPALIQGQSTKALGDYGAKKNFINEKFATRLGLPINRDRVCKVTIGSGQAISTTGVMTAAFRFKGEHQVYDIKFHLLPNCIHDVILGKSFLKLTETLSNLTKFYQRVKQRVIRGISQFNFLYLGAGSAMFNGYVNGNLQTALADSGSKVLVMDEGYARSIGVSIRTGIKYQMTLRFADNSTADTSGMAFGVEWRFGRDGEFTTPYRLDFHILKNAPANVILCDTFLYDNEAFSRYQHFLVDGDDYGYDDDEDSECFLIDYVRKKPIQTTSTASTLEDLRYQEVIRRGEAEDRIAALPLEDQAAERNREQRQQEEWDRAFAELQRSWQTQRAIPLAANMPQLQPTQSAHLSPRSSQVQGSTTQNERQFLTWPSWMRRRQPEQTATS